MAVYKPSVHLGEGHAARCWGWGQKDLDPPWSGTRQATPAGFPSPWSGAGTKPAPDATCCVGAEHRHWGGGPRRAHHPVTTSQRWAHARASWTFQKFFCEGKPSEGERMPPHSRHLLCGLQPDHSAARGTTSACGPSHVQPDLSGFVQDATTHTRACS